MAPQTAPQMAPQTHTFAEGELGAYHQNGFHVARQVLEPHEVDQIRKVFMEQAEKGPVAGLSETGRITDPDDPLYHYPRMMHPHRHPDRAVGQIALRYMLDGRIGEVLSHLLGEPPIAAQSMFYFKPPGSRGQDLHQDNFFLKVRPGTCMAAWIAIDDADPGNGGMVVVPGSHRLDIVCPEASDSSQSFTAEHVEPPEGMNEHAVTLEAGDVLFFNGSVIHGSHPNTSENRFRRALICHYVPQSCEEVGKWYQPLYDFDGNIVSKEVALDSGPCGVSGDAAPH